MYITCHAPCALPSSGSALGTSLSDIESAAVVCLGWVDEGQIVIFLRAVLAVVGPLGVLVGTKKIITKRPGHRGIVGTYIVFLRTPPRQQIERSKPAPHREREKGVEGERVRGRGGGRERRKGVTAVSLNCEVGISNGHPSIKIPPLPAPRTHSGDPRQRGPARAAARPETHADASIGRSLSSTGCQGSFQ